MIGYQAVYDEGFYSAIDYAKEKGFSYVSFDLNVPRFYLENLSYNQRSQLKEYSIKNNIGIAFHAPGDNISLFSDYPSIQKGILEHFTHSDIR